MNLVDFFQTTPWLWLTTSLVIGLLIGSFLNVLIFRLPVMLEREWQAQAREVLELPGQQEDGSFNLIQPNSCCPHCSAPIRAWQNIPLVSWLLLRGRCYQCREPISLRYPLVELAMGLLTVFVAWHLGVTWLALGVMVLTWGLLALSLIDVDHQYLPDVLVLPLLWLGLILNSTQHGFVTLQDAVYGAVFGYLSLWTVFKLFKLFTGKEGMGYGDFKLLAMLGAWGGWQILPLTILLSSLVGAVLGIIILQIQRKGMQQTLPFGPYLALAGWIALLWGEHITDAYMQFAGL